MLDLLRSHPTTLALGVVGWLTYQSLTATPPKAKAGDSGELPVVTAEAVAQRPVGTPAALIRNPFPALAIDGLFKRPEAEGAEGGGAGGDVDEDGPPEPVIVIERRPAFELHLDSIFAFGPGGGHARINGQDVHPGEVISGCDPDAPPVLVALSGLSARIEHRGQEVDLHLDLMPSLSLGGEVIRHELPAEPSAEQLAEGLDAGHDGAPLDDSQAGAAEPAVHTGAAAGPGDGDG